MRLSFTTWRAVLAAGGSLWIGGLACVVGCALPTVAHAGGHELVHSRGEAAQSDASPMAGMENCPHQAGGKVPGEPGDGKSPGGSMPWRMSCCPPEVTVAPKSPYAVPAIVVVATFVVAAPLSLLLAFGYFVVKLFNLLPGPDVTWIRFKQLERRVAFSFELRP